MSMLIEILMLIKIAIKRPNIIASFILLAVFYSLEQFNTKHAQTQNKTNMQFIIHQRVIQFGFRFILLILIFPLPIFSF